jgi:hypothetical protein
MAIKMKGNPVSNSQTAIMASDRRTKHELVGKRVIVTVPHMLCALTDRRIGRGIAQLLTLAHGTATGKTKDQRCFICCRRWTENRGPVGVMVMEIIGAEEALLIRLVCGGCFTGNDADPAVRAALQRDLGVTPEFMHQPATQHQ